MLFLRPSAVFSFFGFFLIFFASNVFAQEFHFKETTHDFGQIPLTDTLEYQFWYANTGAEAGQIVKAETDCACTTSDLQGKILQPGEGTMFKIRFLPYHIGTFLKKFELTDNKGKKYTLFIKGEFIEKLTNEKVFPHSVGVLRSKSKIFNFGLITTQMPVTKKFELYNPSDKDFVMDGRFDTPGHLKVLYDSSHIIKAGETGSLYVVYDAAAKNDYGYLSDTIAIFSKDTVIRPVVAAAIEAYFPKLSESEMRKQPYCVMPKRVFNLGSHVKKDTVFAEFDLSNKGKSPLLIYKLLFSYGGGLAENLPQPLTVLPGETKIFKIWLAKTGKSPKLSSLRSVSLITNDPRNHVLTVKYKVTLK
jgi:hypothetical protein